MCYKIRNNNTLSYLHDFLLPYERRENIKNLRNQTENSNPLTRLKLHRIFIFFLLWNNLTPEIKSNPTVSIHMALECQMSYTL